MSDVLRVWLEFCQSEDRIGWLHEERASHSDDLGDRAPGAGAYPAVDGQNVATLALVSSYNDRGGLIEAQADNQLVGKLLELLEVSELSEVTGATR
jgi:hypothetical protein